MKERLLFLVALYMPRVLITILCLGAAEVTVCWVMSLALPNPSIVMKCVSWLEKVIA